MFLSKIELNAGLRKTQAALASPHVMHGIVEQSFMSLKERQRVLWRIDRLGAHPCLLVQSEVKPDFSHVVEQCGWPAAGQTWETKDCGAFLTSIKNGQKLRFRLCANTVRSVGGEEAGGRGKVVAHIGMAYRKKWLADRAPKLGFSVTEESFDITGSDWKRFKKGRTGPEVSLLAVTFEGILSVEDADKLRDAIVGGIGRGKAYGCGLLSLARH